MSNYITGFCAVGGCEGSNKLSASGARLGPCRGVYQVRSGSRVLKVVCTHDCHKAFAEIREMMAAMGKIVQPPVPVAAQETATPTVAPTPGVVPAPADTAPVAPPRPGLLPFQRPTLDGMARTPTGRAAKGALEEQVRQVLKKAHVFVPMDMVTPGYIARAIDKENPPSQGAIAAVMDRWEKRGLIEVARKPLRISKITSLGNRILVQQ